MNTQSIQHVTEIKLQELTRQFEKLSLQYQQLASQVSQATMLQDKFKLLAQGLSAITFAQKKLHPTVENLDVLHLQLANGTINESLLNTWVRNLEGEIAKGESRLNAALLFGLLLKDANSHPTKDGVHPEKASSEKRFAQLWQQSSSQININALNQWLETHLAGSLNKIQEQVAAFSRQEVFNAVTKNEISAHLRNIIAAPYRHMALKQEARQIIENDTMISECASAITILLNDIENWEWDKKGGDFYSVWTQSKWRPYHKNNLIQTLLLQVAGVRWGVLFKNAFEQHLLISSYDYTIEYQRKEWQRQLFLHNIPTQAELFTNGFSESYERDSLLGDQVESFVTLTRLVHAETHTLLKRQEKENKALGVYVLQADLQDFFLTLPHEIVLALLQKTGVTDPWLSFFEKYLKLPFQYQGEACPTRQGVSLSYTLSSVLTDLLLLPLTPALRKEKGYLHRFMDDMYLVTASESAAKKSWELLNQYCQICGLKINDQKKGGVLIGKQNSDFIDQFGQWPQWSFLEFNPEGQWQIKDSAVQQYTQNLVQHLALKDSIFSLVATYNAHLNYLIRGLAPGSAWGSRHLQAISQCLANVHQHLFGNKQGIFDLLKKRIVAKFPAMTKAIARLPDAWFHWSVTAGGLTLIDPQCIVASLRQPHEVHKPPVINSHEEGEGEWISYYNALATAQICAVNPTSTVIMEGLVNDFINRGFEVSGKTQQGLSPYWRWVLYTYGPQLLESFGTFRFLMAELVPLQVVYQSIARQTPESPKTTNNPHNFEDDDIPF